MAILIRLLDNVNLFGHQRIAEVQASDGKGPHLEGLLEEN